MAQNSNEDTVRVARIGKPHGIRGEVTVEVFTDSPETRFSAGNTLTVHPADPEFKKFETLTVQKYRWNNKILLLKFAEFSDRNTAEEMRNSHLYAPADDPLSEDEGWYAEDLKGMAIHHTNVDSPKIGEVIDLVTGAAQDLVQIRLNDGSEVLIPFVEEIVPEIDQNKAVMIITPPPGLLELNQS